MKRLPATIEELAGRRAARWIRESTSGQFDRYGPEAQAEMQDRAMARLGLTDSGLAWRAAHSGRTVYRSAEMVDMLGSAQRGEFDVLLVGYVSRWQRNLRRTLELLEDRLHPAGVPVYFCDEEILSSSERHWDQLVDEAKDAERYSRRLSRRIKEGYASKLARSVTQAVARPSASGGMRPSCLNPIRSASGRSGGCSSSPRPVCRTAMSRRPSPFRSLPSVGS